jgi:hypothetical protein
MAITEAFTGTNASVGNTEYSCPNAANYVAGGSAGRTEDGIYQVFLDVSDMIVGDTLRIRIREKCLTTSTQQIIYESILSGPQADLWVSPSLILLHAWDVTIQATTGTVSVSWSIRKVA